MARVDCRHFNGYKPCGKNPECDNACQHFAGRPTKILIVHLEALGAVLRATSILQGVRRKYPDCHITWVTQAPAQALLQNNKLIDRRLTTSNEDLLALRVLQFDVGFCIDKSLKAAGVLKLTHCKTIYGFTANTDGAILPANVEAEELWRLGLSDQAKFFENKKPETQLMHEALNLGNFQRDEYVYELTAEELEISQQRRQEWSLSGQKIIVGVNTGCSPVIPYKKLSIETHRELLNQLGQRSELSIVLLGGKEDAERNSLIAKTTSAFESPYHLGLRDGAASVAACDLIISGDSLGMHMAIALQKWVVAWFGPTCAHEIDLYDRGEKILTQATCSPCWRRSCQKPIMCYDLVELQSIMDATLRGVRCLTSSYRQPFSEISF